MRFNQLDHARPRAGARLCGLHAWNALILHWLFHRETIAVSFCGNPSIRF
jgi:hypothetical protein